MFRSLLKYKLKASAKIIFLLSAILMVISLLTGFLLSSNMPTGSNILLNSYISSIITTMFLFVGYAIAVPLLQYYGFYKQHFGNEGYFTFSLPVTTHQHVLSSAVCVLIWNLFMYVTVILAGVLLILPSALKYGSEFTGTVSTIYTDGQLIFAIIFYLLSNLVYSCVFPLVAISLGAMVAKRHKLLAAFGIGLGISWCVTALTGTLSGNTVLYGYAVTRSLIISALVYLALAVGGYFLTYYIFKKKINI